MPNLFARLVKNPRDIILIGDVCRLAIRCFKKRKDEDGISIICIDNCLTKNDVFALGENFVARACGYGKLQHNYICSIEYDNDNKFCCSVKQTGKRTEHFEIRPDPKDITEIKSFETVVACDLVAKKLSEHSIAVSRD